MFTVKTASFIIYSFAYSCGSAHVSACTLEVHEHRTAWMNTGAIKAIASAVQSLVIESDYAANSTETLLLIYEVSTTYSHLLKCVCLLIVKAMSNLIIRYSIIPLEEVYSSTKIFLVHSSPAQNGTTRLTAAIITIRLAMPGSVCTFLILDLCFSFSHLVFFPHMTLIKFHMT